MADAKQGDMDEEILAVISASPLRRWFGVGMLAGIAVFAFWIMLMGAPSFAWQVFLAVTGGAALWMAERMRRATEARLELTETELRDSSGRRIALVDEIEAVERGALAFKPSNGFLIRTRTPGPNTWRPGLWWRMGRRIGVGGVTPAHQGKLMADIIAAILLQKKQ